MLSAFTFAVLISSDSIRPQHHGIKCREKNIPTAITAIINGVRKPQIGKQDRTNKKEPTMPQAVIIGITRGQYTPQNSGDEADTVNVGDGRNLKGR